MKLTKISESLSSLSLKLRPPPKPTTIAPISSKIHNDCHCNKMVVCELFILSWHCPPYCDPAVKFPTMSWHYPRKFTTHFLNCGTNVVRCHHSSITSFWQRCRRHSWCLWQRSLFLPQNMFSFLSQEATNSNLVNYN